MSCFVCSVVHQLQMLMRVSFYHFFEDVVAAVVVVGVELVSVDDAEVEFGEFDVPACYYYYYYYY